ncbi:hypothetical protein FH972_013766 [Carpinus fangiana]|uniref:Uncharacterized protein n=1 Tax=Carpinus fangiana TaxID=176857 RepID=A0A5N6RAV2_9ROSI|nr:hypothetical protein FH972_013766 [Carpinus fangiana]
MEDEDKEKKKQKNYPSLPSNYVTLVHLQQRWLKEKERKQRDKEEEDERQRKLELQKKLEEEQKRKLRPRGLKGGTRIDYEPARGNRKSYWQPNRREVEVSPAMPEKSEVVDTVNVSVEQEQKSEESQEQKSEESKEPARGNRKSYRQPNRRDVGVSPAKPKESEVVTVVVDTVNVSAEQELKSEESKEPARGYRKSSWQRNRRDVGVSPAKPKESEVVTVVVDTLNVSAEQEQKGEESKEPGRGNRKSYRQPNRRDVGVSPAKPKESEVVTVVVDTVNVSVEQEQKSEESKEPARGNRKSSWQRNRRDVEVSPAKPDESEVVAVVVDTVNVSAEQEQKSEGSKEPAHGKRKSSGQQYRRKVEVSPAKPEESEAVAVVVDTVNVSAKQEQKSEESKKEKKKKRREEEGMKPRAKEKEVEKNTWKKKGGMKHKAKKEVTDGMSNAPRVISEKENAPAKRDGESKGTMSEFRHRRESGERKAEIEGRFGDLSINSGIERVNVRAEKKEEKKEATDGIGIGRVNVRATRLNIHTYRGVNRGNGEYTYRGHNGFGARREVRNQSCAGGVWVRKGEIPDCNAGGVRSSK